MHSRHNMVVQALQKQPNNSICYITQIKQQSNVLHKALKTLVTVATGRCLTLCLTKQESCFLCNMQHLCNPQLKICQYEAPCEISLKNVTQHIMPHRVVALPPIILEISFMKIQPRNAQRLLITQQPYAKQTNETNTTAPMCLGCTKKSPGKHPRFKALGICNIAKVQAFALETKVPKCITGSSLV